MDRHKPDRDERQPQLRIRLPRREWDRLHAYVVSHGITLRAFLMEALNAAEAARALRVRVVDIASMVKQAEDIEHLATLRRFVDERTPAPWQRPADVQGALDWSKRTLTALRRSQREVRSAAGGRSD